MSDSNQKSLVAVSEDLQVLAPIKVVQFTNKAQAIALALSMDKLMPDKAKLAYQAANEALIKAMNLAIRD